MKRVRERNHVFLSQPAVVAEMIDFRGVKERRVNMSCG